MKERFGILDTGEEVSLYTISAGGITVRISDLGATIVNLYVPDRCGNCSDIVLGYDTPQGYLEGTCYLGAVVGRSANRIKNSEFTLGTDCYHLTPNENGNNLHSGPNCYHTRMWNVSEHCDDSITFTLHSPNRDQGYPGNADICVTYRLDSQGGLHIQYDGVCDRDTVFNMTNHSYFNLAGQDHPTAAMSQTLTMPARYFAAADAESIPTGELRSVAGTPMDFRTPKAIGLEIDADYDALQLQGGYDHNFEVFCNPCAILSESESGRNMAVYTDLPGVQFYAGNFLQGIGKAGAELAKRSAICLETQFYPDAIHHPEWRQPITRAGEHYRTETIYRFSW